MEIIMNDSNLMKLFSKPLPSTRSGAFYNTFPYPTKISPEAIAVYIASLTEPGDTVLDAFGGSGSTGIAALLCEYPTIKMKKLAKEFDINPKWGKRNAVIYEISTYGPFAARTLTNRLKANEFKSAVKDFIQQAENELNWYYRTKDPYGNEGIIRHIIWSEMLICPSCGNELSYFDNGTSRNPVQFLKTIKCPYCQETHDIQSFKPALERVYDSLLNKYTIRKKRVPAWVYGTTNGKNWDRKANDDDRNFMQSLEKKNYEPSDIPKEICWGELHRAGYHLGITHLHQFYTKRNYSVMYRLWRLTEQYPDKVRDALQLLLLSYNATHCTMMTRVVAKRNSKDFVLTGAQSGVLYISRLPVEKNILLGLKRKYASFYEAYSLLEKCTGELIVHNSSSEKMEETMDSIDFVFTDPPFGDFIPYAEVNQINELWMKRTTDRSKEIIISSSQEKSISDYQHMLTNVFSGIARVLKQDHYVAVVFHAAKAKIWEAFENAIMDSGLAVCTASILDKKQASFKQVVSTASVQGDPLVLLKAAKQEKNDKLEDQNILDVLIEKFSNFGSIDERRIYSLYVNECLKRRQVVALDAKDAYAYIRSFIEGYCEEINE